nr:uncharacterized protein LOC108949833 [Ciona intestinalis]|eukprot:XP_018669192.1 uncharacterized protein LOC108949833 [Ciona intestinalis]
MTDLIAAMQYSTQVEYQVAFCDPFPYPDPVPGNKSYVTLWESMPVHCRQRMEGFIGMMSVLAVFTTVFNLVVLAANLTPRTRRLRSRNPTMQNYSTYVISMAMADVIVGAIVLPLVVANFYKEATAKRPVILLDSLSNRTNASYHTTITIVETLDQNGSATERELQWLTDTETPESKPWIVGEPEGLNRIRNCLGVLAHVVIFVSVYTLAAASADRFYTSTKPISSRPITLSSSSFRRTNKNASPELAWSVFNVSRSTFAVIIIWIAGLLFGLAPLGVSRDFHFRPVGHIFVALSSDGSYVASLTWYGLALALPLVVTWLFSFLICVTLWRRKRRLKHSKATRNYSTKSLNRRSSDREQDISVRQQTSRISVSASHATCSAAERVLSNETEGGLVVTDDQPFSDVFEEAKEPKVPDVVSTPPYRGGLQRRRRSSIDLGVSLRRQNSDGAARPTRTFHRRVGSLEDPVRTPDADPVKTQAGFVAMRILYRKSWNGCPDEPQSLPQSPDRGRRILPATPALPRSIGSFSSIPTCQINSPKTPTRERRCEASRPRAGSSRVRRKSSVYRARELLMSKSFETNIAKTLCAVVLACTVAVLPLLITVTTLTKDDDAPKEILNAEVTTIVVSMTILFSNCLWNSLIYGSRMPYFRRTVIRIIRQTTGRAKRSKGGRIISSLLGSVRRSVGAASLRSNVSGPADNRADSAEETPPNT